MTMILRRDQYLLSTNVIATDCNDDTVLWYSCHIDSACANMDDDKILDKLDLVTVKVWTI